MKAYRVLTVISTWQDVEAEDKEHAIEVAAANETDSWDHNSTEITVTELRASRKSAMDLATESAIRIDDAFIRGK